jgi:outer membrane receptor protein involved in Fe transport
MKAAIKIKSLLMGGACLAAIAASPAFAQTPDAEGQVEEVVVTGSRIQTGFQTPTPVTTAAAADLRIAAPNNLADGLNQLPVFNGSTKLSYPTTTNQPGAASGQNLLSMRGLGSNRNLILLDGRRMPATNGGGSVDVNIMPQSLVQRVDVVTGGASAAYGSDAVAGVVNFILDTRFEGLKGEVQGGVSTYGDLPSFGGSVAYGRSFAEGRGRFIASGEYFQQRGKGVDDDTGRDWFERAPALVPKPVGLPGPSRLIAPNVVSSVATYGGLITGGPLKGTQFLAGGATAPFNYGTLTGTAYQSGGDGARANVGLMPDLDRYSGFAHGEYDFSEHATLFVEGLYSHSHTTSDAFYLQTAGTSNQYTIFRDNAYLPANIRNLMTQQNIASFTMGRFERDLPPVENESFLDVYRGSIGLKGALSGSWTYDASFTRGCTVQDLRENDLSIARPLYAAADAVFAPNGQIVCRSTLSGLDPGCIPRNLFGEQPNNDAINAYVTGDSWQVLTIDQTVWAANINGDLGDRFQLGAGPIAVAAGVEYRREAAKQTVDAISASIIDLTGIRGFPAAQQGKLGPFRHNNPQALAGRYDIKEAYIEVGLPVLKDLAFARALDLNGAARRADYSTFGGVTTWKAGVNWQVVDDLRLRLTRSRDIRGGNILELFNAESQITNNTIYRGVSTATLNIASGNPNLRPEIAATLTYGAVYRPSWLPGFQISLDYYRISIKDAIGSIGGQRLIDECAAGNTALCAFISPPTATSPLILRNPSTNLDIAKTAGYDLEAAYVRQFAGGNLSLRLLGNHIIRDYTKSPGSPLNQQLGSPTSPRYRATFQIRYNKDAWSLFWQTRYQSSGKLAPNLVEGVDISAGDNAIPDIAYSDLGGSFDINAFGHSETLFFSVTNLFNQKPPTSPPQTTTFSRGANTAYDPVGRYFTAGLRFRY